MFKKLLEDKKRKISKVFPTEKIKQTFPNKFKSGVILHFKNVFSCSSMYFSRLNLKTAKIKVQDFQGNVLNTNVSIRDKKLLPNFFFSVEFSLKSEN